MTSSTSPQQPSLEIAAHPDETPDRVRVLAAEASQAQRAWGGTPGTTRSKILEEAAARIDSHASELIALLVAEVGKPLVEAAAELGRAADILRYHAQQALDPIGDVLPTASGRGLLFSRSVPRGLACLITPWNFPLAIPVWKAAPALAHGNTVLLKPSPDALGVALKMEEILAGVLPERVFTVVPGGATTAEALIDVSDLVSFTGSEQVGRRVIERGTARGIPVQAEMSGLNASIVLADADLASASKMIAASAMSFAGQKCTATSRIVLVGPAREGLDAIVAAVESLRVGDPAHDQTSVGPVISERARTVARQATDEAVRAGGKLLTGGGLVEEEGWWVQPTLIDELPVAHELNSREVFAPLALVSRADTLEEAIEQVNRSRFGLVTSVFTENLGDAMASIDSLATGLIRVNAPTTFVDLHAPFGGERSSSFGSREQGKSARDLYTSTRTVTVSGR